MLACAALVYRRLSKQVYLLDFACYRPSDELKVTWKRFMRGSRDCKVSLSPYLALGRTDRRNNQRAMQLGLYLSPKICTPPVYMPYHDVLVLLPACLVSFLPCSACCMCYTASGIVNGILAWSCHLCCCFLGFLENHHTAERLFVYLHAEL